MSTSLLFGLLPQVIHERVDNCHAGALHHRLTGSENPCCPHVMALEHCGGGQRNQRVDER